MSKTANRMRKRRKNLLELPKGVWLTEFKGQPEMVERAVGDRVISRKPKDGMELLADLMYQDSQGNLHLLERGYVWDKSSFRDSWSWLLGDRDDVGMLAGSAFHDAPPDEHKIFKAKTNGHEQVSSDYGILKDALLYVEMIRSHPETRVTWRQRARQVVGLLLGQRIWRRFSGGRNARWRKVEL